LLIGPRGTGKTTAVRSLVDLLPLTPRSLCYYGCTPDDIEIGGIEVVCPDCARKYAMGEPLVKLDKVRLVELPLNARLEDVVGGVDERAAVQDRLRFRKGILAQADRNLLYIDEVNLLADDVVDAILDAAAQGSYTVRRGPLSATYRSRFVLMGSMNPEEGRLRPQIMDRFGLRVVVRGLNDLDDRLEVYRRVQAYQAQPRRVIQQFSQESAVIQSEIQLIRDTLPEVILPDSVARIGLELISRLKLDSSRSEISLFEAARSYAALDGRKEVAVADIYEVAPMTLRMRRSVFMEEFFANQDKEDRELRSLLNDLHKEISG
jgi:magnesium chelatase subunit I